MKPAGARDDHSGEVDDSEVNAATPDPVLEIFKREIDFTLVEKNLRLTTEQRAQQLANATQFIRKFRPLVKPVRD